MSDFPLDEELNSPPISPSSSENNLSVILASHEFSPEDLTPSQLHFTWSSGDIPVLLYDEAYVCIDQEGFSISDFTIASAVNVDDDDRSCISVPSSGLNDDAGPGSVGDRPSRVNRTSRCDSGFLGLESLDSSNTISSVGTFGPRRKNHRKFTQEDGAKPLPEKTSLDCAAPTPVSGEKEGDGLEECLFISDIRERRSTIVQNLSGIFASPSVLADLKRTSLIETNSMNGIPEAPRINDQNRRSTGLPEQSEVDTSSTIQLEDAEPDSPCTPRKSNPKTISWISSRDWDCQQYKEYIAQADLSCSPGSPSRPGISGSIDENEDENSTPNPRRRTPIRSKVFEHRDLNVIVETPRASQFAREIHEYLVEKPTQQQTRHPAPNRNSVRYDEYSWLKNINVQFLVDQEGFRAAQPSFRFTGIARLRRSQNSRGPTTIMAQFRPTTRQAFHFHYAPFESPPILRRVTVNLDETHDYLTKQALLTLKSNGVYVLHGQEMSHPAPDAEPSKLFWQFEYMIDDRRVEASGRIMEGEKNLTPLTFSCSPALLLLTQGKRNSIMHVFKKGVATKLVAERLQPPGTSSAAKKSGNEAHPIEADIGHTSNFFTSKAHAWNLHKRGQSHGVQNISSQKAAMPNVQLSHNTVLKSPPARHRRASSGGESQRPSSGRRFSTLVPSATRCPEGLNVVTTTTPSRHIIPPHKLAELLDTPCSSSEGGQSPASIRPSSHFVPLTPRPRYVSHIKDLSHSYTR